MDEASIYHAFGRAVAARRTAIGKTQAKLAEEVGISRGSIANIELGNQKVFLHHVLAISAALGLESPQQILPSREPFLAGRSTTRPRVTGTRRLTPQQRSQIEAIALTLLAQEPERDAS